MRRKNRAAIVTGGAQGHCPNRPLKDSLDRRIGQTFESPPAEPEVYPYELFL